MSITVGQAPTSINGPTNGTGVSRTPPEDLVSKIAGRVEEIYATSSSDRKTIESLRKSLRERDKALASFHKQNSDLRVELSSLLFEQKRHEHEDKFGGPVQSDQDSFPPTSIVQSPTELLAHSLSSVQKDLWEAKKEIEVLHAERASASVDLFRLKEHNTTLAKAVTLAVAESEKSREEASYLTEELKVRTETIEYIILLPENLISLLLNYRFFDAFVPR